MKAVGALLTFVVWSFLASAAAVETPELLLPKTVLLGPDKLEWDHFKEHEPAQKALEHTFQVEGQPGEHALLIRQMDVKAEGWTIFVNEKKVATLPTIDEPAWILVPLQINVLKQGENKLRITHAGITGANFTDQIEIGQVKLFRGATSNLFSSTCEIDVRGEKGEELPCRVTITDMEGALISFQNLSGATVAARPGVAYTANGKAKLGLLPGKYKVFATRGSEYSLGMAQFELRREGLHTAKLRLKREVPTPGFVAADTHIHTRTHSGHGDATADERVITIAGEGIELPIVTEHNLHASYAEPAKRLGVNQHFTLVTGNEVTTRRGHFNIFPVELTAPPPDAKVEDWTELLRLIRKTPTVEVVILNHPTDTHSGFVPFASSNLVPRVGRSPSVLDFGADAVEVINSGAMRSDWMEPYRGWFALLNYGQKILSVGGSDSHDVSRFSLGQGRTYLQVNDTAAGSIDIEAACESFKAGRVYVSLGLFPKITVNGKHSMGDLVPGSKRVQVEVEVLGPTWIEATKVELFANGIKVAEAPASRSNKTRVRKLKHRWDVPLPANDVWLVAIASGPGVREPYWTIPRPYQPTSTNANSPGLGSTNPVWVDSNRDGVFTPARARAEKILENSSAREVAGLLGSSDEAVLLQAGDLIALGKSKVPANELREALRKGPERLRAIIAQE